MLNIDHCTFSYKRSGKPTIDDFSLSINEGGVYGLLGSNGAGKTTLLYLICGLLTPADGSITLDGVSTRCRLPQTMKDIFIVAEETQLPAITLKDYVRINSTFYPNFSQEDMTSHLNLFDMDADTMMEYKCGDIGSSIVQNKRRNSVIVEPFSHFMPLGFAIMPKVTPTGTYNNPDIIIAIDYIRS